jgi:hypothetical protein
VESAEHPVPENWRAAAARREAAPTAAIEDMLRTQNLAVL